jgi:S1-C subfamily serine protease
MIFERVSFNGKLLERRFIDTESLSRNDFSTNIQYTIRVEEYWEAKIRSNITRTVVVNCQDRSRFEVVSESDLTLKPFKSVFAETSIGNEVDFACEKSKFSRSKTSSANENQTAPNPETLPKARAPSTGSGFVVSKNRVLTSAHVVAECQKIEIRQGAVKRSGSIISTDERTDLALISFDQVSMMIPYIRNSAILGEDVMVAGYPLAGLLGSELIVTTGQVNSLAGIRNDSTLLQVSAPVQPGNSGGPLVDRNGNIVGVVVSKLNVERVSKLTGDFAQNINFAVKPEIIRLFLSANGIEQTIPKKLKRLENQDIAQRAKEFVVQIVCN